MRRSGETGLLQDLIAFRMLCWRWWLGIGCRLSIGAGFDGSVRCCNVGAAEPGLTTVRALSS
jgi:hypothetical protein